MRWGYHFVSFACCGSTFLCGLSFGLISVISCFVFSGRLVIKKSRSEYDLEQKFSATYRRATSLYLLFFSPFRFPFSFWGNMPTDDGEFYDGHESDVSCYLHFFAFSSFHLLHFAALRTRSFHARAFLMYHDRIDINVGRVWHALPL